MAIICCICVVTPPKIVGINKPHQVNIGDTISINCIVSGFPEPRIEWRILAQGVRKVWFKRRIFQENSANKYKICKINDYPKQIRIFRLKINSVQKQLGSPYCNNYQNMCFYYNKVCYRCHWTNTYQCIVKVKCR